MRRVYLLACATIFGLVAIAHVSRLIVGWDVVIAGWVAPHWVSWPGTLVAGALSVCGFTLAARERNGG